MLVDRPYMCLEQLRLILTLGRQDWDSPKFGRVMQQLLSLEVYVKRK